MNGFRNETAITVFHQDAFGNVKHCHLDMRLDQADRVFNILYAIINTVRPHYLIEVTCDDLPIGH